MSKRQVNFRIDKTTLDLIKAEAEKQNKTHTRWISEACNMRLSADNYAVSQDKLNEREEINQLKKQNNALWSTLDHYGFRLEQLEDQVSEMQEELREFVKIAIHLQEKVEGVSLNSRADDLGKASE